MDKKHTSFNDLKFWLDQNQKLEIDKKFRLDNAQYLNRNTQEIIKSRFSKSKFLVIKSLGVSYSIKDQPQLFPERLNFRGQTIIFSECSFDFQLIFRRIENIENLVFINCDFSEKVFVSNPNYNVLFFDSTFENGLNLDGDEKLLDKCIGLYGVNAKGPITYENRNGSLKDLEIHGINSDLSLVHLNKVKITNFSVSEVGHLGKLQIDCGGTTDCYNEFNSVRVVNSSINSIHFDQIKVESDISFENLKGDQNLYLKTIIAKFLILKSHFSYETISIENSKITEFRVKNFEGNTIIDVLNKTKISTFYCENVLFCKELNIHDGSELEEFKSTETGIVSNFDSFRLNGIKLRGGYFNHLNVEFFIIKKIQGAIDQMTVTNSVFNSFHVNESNVKKGSVSNTKIKENVILRSEEFSHLYFSEFTVLGRTVFNEVSLSNGIEWTNCCFNEGIHFEKSSIASLKIEKSIIRQVFFKSGSKLLNSKVKFKNCVFAQFQLFPIDDLEYFIENCTINTLWLKNNSLSKSSTLSISNSNLNSINLIHCNIYGYLYIRDCKPAKELFSGLLLEEFDSKVIEEINLIEEKSWEPKPNQINLYFSSLGQTEFIEFKFEEYKFKFNNTKLIDCFIAGSQFPQKIEIANIDPMTKEYHNQKVLVYNQLKKIAERNGDIVKSSLMHSKALASQKKVMDKEKGKHSEKVVFWLNEVSNDHGESWLAALKFILIGTIYFFIIFYTSERYISQNPMMLEPNLLWSQYLKFINPFEKITLDRHWISNTVYFLNKIYFSYGVFQLITAFRRHGKK
ncbi:hypothetical protein SAMN06298216_1790 [Spirosomataceae bacterium TFI 002]|nr:hypothetical protein SAMN06298216_1790 [Spirosomataceae bacterium TFI 002]